MIREFISDKERVRIKYYMMVLYMNSLMVITVEMKQPSLCLVVGEY